MTKKYYLRDLDCANCANKIERRVQKLSGVTEVSVSFANKQMLLEVIESFDEAEMIQLIHDLEPEVQVEAIQKDKRSNSGAKAKKSSAVKSQQDSCSQTHEHCEKEGHSHQHDHLKHECCGEHHHEHGEECGHNEHLDAGKAECCGKHHNHEGHDHECCGHFHESAGDEDCGHHHESEGEDCCGHKHEKNQDGCGCGHNHDKNHDECVCDHNHDESDNECECSHHFDYGERGYSNHHHEQDGHACGCGHDHEHEEHNGHEVSKASQYQIQNLDCASCAAKVEDAICRLSCVEDASVNFAAAKLAVRFTDQANAKEGLEEVKKLVKKLEPEVVIRETSDTSEPTKNPHTKEWLRLGAGVIFFLLGLYFKEKDFAVYLFLISFVISGGKVVWQAVRNVLRGEMFDENFLMSVATIGAFLIGDYAEGVTVMLFYEVGELFQSIAVNRSRQNISDLMDIRAEYANLLVDGEEKRVEPNLVHVDDIIRLKPGERVPLDGVLLSSAASLDTSALSGESLPRELLMGDEVLAGSVNLSKVVEIRVTRELEESTVSRILELVQNAGSRKAPMEKFITKFARYYTPAVVAAAVLLAVIPPLVTGDPFQTWLYRALTFLVVSCPCALVVSIPLGLFAGIGGASRKGILVKGGNYLEALKDIDTVVFDKTGTLTKGVFSVQEIIAEDREQVLELAAYGESFSSHPIARSILDAYGKPIDGNRIAECEELSGHGIRAMIDQHEVLLGNALLMKSHGITAKEMPSAGTVVYVGVDGKLAGCIVIADEVKESSAKAIAALKQAGVKRTVMLSGDRMAAVEAIKDQLKLDEVYGELLPQNKVEKVEELIASLPEKGKLAFVGDGINDAPVIARADIGFAMGGIGSDAAIEAADVVLMKDDPLAISEAIAISRKTKKILWQNVIFSLGIKAAVLVLSAFGMATMWMGVFADVGVTLIAVINSMRALRV